jgi:hypothetical protein
MNKDVCTRCGEPRESDFDICWKCGNSFEVTEDYKEINTKQNFVSKDGELSSGISKLISLGGHMKTVGKSIKYAIIANFFILIGIFGATANGNFSLASIIGIIGALLELFIIFGIIHSFNSAGELLQSFTKEDF